MAYPNRKNHVEIELWNVSLLPTVRQVESPPPPPRGPAPDGGRSLRSAPLLSLAERAVAELAAEAA